MSDSTVPTRKIPFSIHTVDDEDVLVPEGRLMLTTVLEIKNGSIEIEGAVEIV